MRLFFRIPTPALVYRELETRTNLQTILRRLQIQGGITRVNVGALLKVQWQGRAVTLLKFNYLEKRKNLG